MSPSSPWQAAVRGIFDVVGSALALIVGAPVLLAIGLWIRFDSPGPALLRQQRVGLGGRPFTFYKFRSMRVGNDDRLHRNLIAAELRGEDPSTGVARRSRTIRASRGQAASCGARAWTSYLS